jgi:hypothetical protein
LSQFLILVAYLSIHIFYERIDLSLVSAKDWNGTSLKEGMKGYLRE